jgi:serine/threonine protein kinase/WD40 repeat protein
MSQSNQSLRTIFNEAVEIVDARQRSEYLVQACGDDTILRQRIEELIAANNEAGRFLGRVGDTGRPAAQDNASSGAALLATITEQAGDKIGRYKLLQKIGEGGCGVVYMAEQEQPLRRRVALKVIKLGMDTNSVIARFEAERQALALMDHPNIAKVFDAGATDAGRPFFVMELVKGVRITDYCDQNNLPTVARLDLFRQVCHAIQHAHQKGIIHRDIKPSNILVTLHDGVPVPKVIDFGIAKATSDQRLTDKTLFTAFEQFMGTPAYMSPEQAEMSGLDIDTRSDIYALGVLLYELLTGKPPFDGKELLASGLDAMRRTIREQEPAKPSTRLSTMLAAELTIVAKHRQSESAKLASSMRGDLDWIVMKALEKDRTRRYDTANGLAMDIARYLNNEPVVARPPGNLYRFEKLIRRNKLAFTAVTAIVVALALGVIGSGWQAIRATHAERVQRSLRGEAEKASASEAQLRALAETQELTALHKSYASDMILAQQALAQNNLGRAEELLNRHRPTKGRPDLRGWEWRYLWQYCRSDALFTLCKEGIIDSLTLSHDGKWAAVGGYDNGELAVWDLDSRKEIARLSGNGRRVIAAFSPRDRQLAFSGWTGSKSNAHHWVRLWDGNDRKVVGELTLESECRGLAYSAEGETLLTATETPSEIVRWRIADHRRLATLPIRDAWLTPEGTTFAVTRDFSLAAHCARESDLSVVDLATGKELWTQRATDARVLALAFSPDGKTLASAAGYVDPDMRLWDVPTGKEIRRLEKHRGFVGSIVFWPDGKTFASAGSDQLIRLWNMTETRPAAILRGHRLEVWRLALLPDGKSLVSGSKDGSVCVWDTSKTPDRKTCTTVPGVFAWGFGENGSSVVVLDRQGRVARWSGSGFRDSEPLFQVPSGFLEACISQDGKWVATVFSNGMVRVWSVTGRELASEFTAGRISESGEAGMSGTRRLQFLAHTNSLVLSYQSDDLLHQWDWKSRQEVSSWPAVPRAFAMGFSSDEQWCLTVGWDGVGSLVNLRDGHERNFDFGLKQLPDAAFSPDGKHFAVPSQTGLASVRETSSLREIAMLRGFMQGVHSVVFSPDGRRLVTGSDGQEAIRFWDTKTWQELITLEGQGAIFRQAAFSADGDSLAASNGQGVLHLWHAPSWAEIDAAEKARERGQ